MTREEVLKIARLARLRLSEEEIGRFGVQLSAILEYVGKLDLLETSTVPAARHPLELETPLRRDVPRDTLPSSQLLESAPETHGPFFAVPKVMDDGEPG